MSRQEDRELAVAALGVLDGLSIRVLGDIRADRHRSGKTIVWPGDLKKLIEAIDAAHPGVVDRYIDARKNDEAATRAGADG